MEKAFDKIQYTFMIKTVNKFGYRGTNLNTIQAVYDKAMANTILSEKLEDFPERSRTSQGCQFLLLLFKQCWKCQPK